MRSRNPELAYPFYLFENLLNFASSHLAPVPRSQFPCGRITRPKHKNGNMSPYFANFIAVKDL